MALCVTLNTDGTLTPTGQDVADCTGYVMVSSSEYGVYQAVNTAFAAPQPSDAMAWFAGGCSTVFFFYIVSYLCGRVASFFDK